MNIGNLKENEVIILEDDTEDVIISVDKSINEISYLYDNCTEDIQSSIDSVFRNFLTIAVNLYEVKRFSLFKAADYKNVYDYAHNEFDLNRTTVKNLIAIADRFCVISSDGGREESLLEKYEDFSFSQLVELLPLSELQIEKYNPVMSVKEIRQNKYKAKILDDFNNLFVDKTSIIFDIINSIKNEHSEYSLDYEIVEDTDYFKNKYHFVYINSNNERLFYFHCSLNNKNEFIMALYSSMYHVLNMYKKFTCYDDIKEDISKFFIAYDKELKSKVESEVKKSNVKEIKIDYSKFDNYIQDYSYTSQAKTLNELNNIIPDVIDKDNLVLDCSIWNTLKCNYPSIDKTFIFNKDALLISFYQNNNLIKEVKVMDLVASAIKEFMTGQTSDQLENNIRLIPRLTVKNNPTYPNEENCPHCNHGVFSLDNFCGRCGQPIIHLEGEN